MLSIKFSHRVKYPVPWAVVCSGALSGPEFSTQYFIYCSGVLRADIGHLHRTSDTRDEEDDEVREIKIKGLDSVNDRVEIGTG